MFSVDREQSTIYKYYGPGVCVFMSLLIMDVLHLCCLSPLLFSSLVGALFMSKRLHVIYCTLSFL
jgi:hypothetical protein